MAAVSRTDSPPGRHPAGPDLAGSDLAGRLVAALREQPRTRTFLVRSGWGSQQSVNALLTEWLEQRRLVQTVTLVTNRAGVRRQRRVLQLADEDGQGPGPSAARGDADAASTGRPPPPPAPWPGGELAVERARLGWSLRQLSQALAVDRAQVAAWERAQVPAAWVVPVRQALAAAGAPTPERVHRPATRRPEEELRRLAKNLICAQPGLTRARVTARMAGTSMARRRAIVEDLVRAGQVLEYREGVEYADGRVLRLRVLRCP